MNANRPADIAAIEQRARIVLATRPHDVEALRMLAHGAAARDVADEAERLLRQAIALAPDFIAAHADLASLLCRLERAEEAIALLDESIAKHPDAIWPLSIKAAVFSAERLAEEALAAHKAVVLRAGHAAVPWMNYAHALKAAGNTEAAIIAYRKAINRDPANGSSWWGLANLRTIRFSADDLALMEQALSAKNRDPLQQVHLHFALGKAFGDLGKYERSFRHYQEANRLRGALVPYEPERTRDFVDRSKALFTAQFFSDRRGLGCDADDVIFIVGMPRSGSTLVEQILASHPMIEGAGELFELPSIASKLTRGEETQASLPDAIARIPGDGLRSVGKRYLRSVQRHRRTDRPFFTDKMPANWQLVPLIHLALPNAKIIDVRRNPLPCCFSGFATYFNVHTSFPTDLADLGRHYADYTRLMAHMDSLFPKRVHRVHYENLVEDVETETKRLLDYLGVPYDPACLSFYDNSRAVHTPSAQQVREPINRDGLNHWRNYEPWLAPLSEGLNAISC